MGFMLSMIASPVIRRPSLEITAAIAQPDGIRTCPSILFIFPPPKKEKNGACLRKKRTYSAEHPRSLSKIRKKLPFYKVTIYQKLHPVKIGFSTNRQLTFRAAECIFCGIERQWRLGGRAFRDATVSFFEKKTCYGDCTGNIGKSGR